MGILTWIIIAIIILAVIGLGWDNFFAGVKKGADKIGIISLLENANNSAVDIACIKGRNWQLSRQIMSAN